jgi:hypothetical protein
MEEVCQKLGEIVIHHAISSLQFELLKGIDSRESKAEEKAKVGLTSVVEQLVRALKILTKGSRVKRSFRY